MKNNHELESWLLQAAQGDAVACYNLGVIYQEQSDIAKAISYYEKAISLNPLLPEAYNNLGAIYKLKNESDKALTYYYEALKIKPDFINVNNNIGVILQSQENFKDAVRFFKKAISLDPNNANSYYNLGLIFEEQNEISEAIKNYEKSFDLDKSHHIAYWSLRLNSAYKSYLDHAECEVAIKDLQELQWWAKNYNVIGDEVVGRSPPFFLTYQERNNINILSPYGDICVSLMQYFQKQLNFNKTNKANKNNKKIRIGFVSEGFHNSSVWHAILKGWYHHFDKNKFEIYSFSLNKVNDNNTKEAFELSDVSFENLNSAQQWAETILAAELDALVYPAIGMHFMTYKLACLRLAPIQIASWGHPETSGLSTIDYYLSADDFEPINAQEHYREKLVRLPNLGSCYEPLKLETIEFDIAPLGVNADTCLLVSPGTPYKYDKRYDYIFAEIAERCPTSKIVFFKSKPDGLSEIFQDRIKKIFTEKGLEVDDHVIFIPAMRKARFHSLMRQADIYLDTIGFSGFNTAMQAVECGLPIITYEGKFMRGRFGGAILRKMGLDELIAKSSNEYIDKTVNLINDKPYRKNIKTKMVEKASRLYSDITVVKKLEDFIVSIVN